MLRGIMRRILPTAIIFLLIGLIANVVVAWVCAAWIDPSRTISIVRGATWVGEELLWYVSHDAQTGHAEVFSHVAEMNESDKLALEQFGLTIPAWGPAQPALTRWSQIRPPDPDDPDSLQPQSANAFGWPRLCMVYTCVWAEDDLTLRTGIRAEDKLTLKTGILLYQPRFVVGDKPFRALPLRPIWGAFALNTLFYALALWLAWFLKILRPFTLLRRIRIKRGRCPSCGYPTGTTSVCTECGALLPMRKSRTREVA